MAEEAQEQQQQEVDTAKVLESTQGEIAKLAEENKKLKASLTRQGYEVGELRKLKEIVDKELLTKTKPSTDEFFADPNKAVENAIQSDPELVKLKQQLADRQFQATVGEKYPDYLETAQDTEFQEWVQASKTRQKLLANAHFNYDADDAVELFEMWSAKKGATKKEDADKAEKKEQLKQASVDTSRGPVGKKMYSRLELMRLKSSDPEAYKRLNVVQLYAEGRVR